MHGGGAELWGWGYTSGPLDKTGPEVTGPDFNGTGNFNIVPPIQDAKFNLSDQHYMH
jgi:hypothetical protein